MTLTSVTGTWIVVQRQLFSKTAREKIVSSELKGYFYINIDNRYWNVTKAEV